MTDTDIQLIVTCEHGGNQVPAEYQWLFDKEQTLLDSHRGYDPGSLSLARQLAERFRAPLFYSETTRLLIELNRSLDHRQLFSTLSKRLSAKERAHLIKTMYQPYRQQVTEAIQKATAKSPVVHISVHSFTSEFKGRIRTTGIGLLFDPARPLELQFCNSWRAQLKRDLPQTDIHFNRPYRGTSDGFTTALRKQFSADRYAGIELEVNSKFVDNQTSWTELQERMTESLTRLITNETGPVELLEVISKPLM